MIINIAGNRQRGATTLLVAIVLLFSITLVTLFTARVVLTDTKVEANNYRARQAVASANAAMDRAVAYFDEDGLDHQDGGPCTATVGRDENVDDTSCLGFTYNNADGICTTAADMKSALVTATGTSDDGIASRTIYQCLGTIDVFGGNGPKQPLISRGSVGLTGNYNIINRYTNTTGWSGGVIDIGSSASASTYTRPVGTSSSDFSRAQKEDNDVTNAYTSEPVSDRNKGNGVDTIANDPRLSTLTGDELFNSFFFKDKAGMEELADGQNQSYSSMGDFETDNGDGSPVEGVIWIEGDATLNGGTIGTAESPVVLILNGNVGISGNPDIYGLIYITGQMDATGTLSVYGSSIVEGNDAIVPAGEDPVVGHGGVDLIYTPYALDENPNPLPGLTTVISGSWRDWS